ncbi:MAG: M48 family metalloprotease [Candidatus Omnitrophota bacterium]|nr:M48 family metalloprotease [Candidatus Omnitrophota bacterium]
MARMAYAVLIAMIVVAAGCSRIDRKGVISQELPLTLDDLVEIRAGEQNHRRVLEEYQIYDSPKFETYLNAIASSIAAVSTRPHLPYHVILLDSDDVNIFGGPGGYIYMTRGMVNFVRSESELAGIIAHEIGHISYYEYSHIPKHDKMKKAYDALSKGTELARNSIGTYGTAAYYAVKYTGKAAPYIGRQFGKDAEIHADEKAVEYLVAAGYDPRGFKAFVERLTQIEMDDVSRFVVFMNTHPPFQDRRTVLEGIVEDDGEEPAMIDFKQDMLSEVRQITVNSSDSIVFAPQMGVHQAHPMEMNESLHEDDKKIPAAQKRVSWF